jgi:hypothetical protein
MRGASKGVWLNETYRRADARSRAALKDISQHNFVGGWADEHDAIAARYVSDRANRRVAEAVSHHIAGYVAAYRE